MAEGRLDRRRRDRPGAGHGAAGAALRQTRTRTSSLVPEKRLLLAVLEEAVVTFQRYATEHGRRGRRLFREAEEWMGSEELCWPCSFRNICDALGLDPGYLRRGLRRWRDEQEANPGSTRRTAIRSAGSAGPARAPSGDRSGWVAARGRSSPSDHRPRGLTRRVSSGRIASTTGNLLVAAQARQPRAVVPPANLSTGRDGTLLARELLMLARDAAPGRRQDRDTRAAEAIESRVRRTVADRLGISPAELLPDRSLQTIWRWIRSI